MQTIAALYILAVFTLLIGWGINLVEVIVAAIQHTEFTTFFVVQVVGIFVFPLGSILGLFFF